MKPSCQIGVGLVALLALAPCSLHGQQVPPRLTLEQALRMAAERNPAYLQSQEQQVQAAVEERRGYGAFLPTANLNANVGGLSSRRLTGEDEFGRPVSLPQAIDFTSSSSQQSLTMQYTLFDGGRRFRELRAARASGDVADARVDAEAARLRAEVTRRFHEAVRAGRVVALQHRLLAGAREQLDATRAMLRVAASDPVDVLGAEVEVATREQDVARAQADDRKARIALAEVLGADPGADFELAETDITVFDPSELAEDELVELALSTSPRLAQAEAGLRAARHSASVARSLRWPSLNASAGVSRGMSVGSMAALTELNPQNRALSFGLSASIPLLTQNQASSRVADADSRTRVASEELRAQRLAVEGEIRSAVADLEGAYLSLRLADRSADLSRTRVELAQERYRLGTLSFMDLQGVIERAAQAELAVLNAQRDFVFALANLEERLGREVPR